MKDFNDIIVTRKHRADRQKYEQALREYRAACKAIATDVVDNMIDQMSESDDNTFVLILGTNRYIFCTKDVALANQGVEVTLEFPKKPEAPKPSQNKNCMELVSTKCPVHIEWQYIKEAIKEAHIPAKEVRIFGDYLVFIISM